MTYVLDASVALAWCFAKLRTEEALALLHRLPQTGAAVPWHFHLEVLDGLLVAERRGRTHELARRNLAGFLRLLPLTPEAATDPHHWAAVMAVAGRYRLGAFQAAYLEMALRRGLGLASLDPELRRAAGEARLDISALPMVARWP